jgi:hypothetical protein
LIKRGIAFKFGRHVVALKFNKNLPAKKMKLTFKLLFVLIIPVKLFAQDPATVKEQANIVAQAVVASDYKTLIDHMYPRAVTLFGGKENLMKITSDGMARLKAQGISFLRATVEVPAKFYKAGAEIHCLVPETMTIKLPNGTVTASSNLLAISSDKGRTWTFLDLNKNTIAAIPKLFPNFNNNLKIPEPQQPVRQ